MKRTVAIVLCFLLMLTGCQKRTADVPQTTTQPQEQSSEPIHAVWVTCYELKQMLCQSGETAFQSAFEMAAKRCEQNGINHIFVQVRPFCDAFYCSDLFEWSSLCRDENGHSPSFDPLKVMVTTAHAHGLKIHAWVNPYRISYEEGKALPMSLSAYESYVGCTANGTYFDPSAGAVRELILNGMREILSGYSVDGIHMDDYFYPTKDEDFDRKSYAEACALGNALSLADWRREQVNFLLRGAYSLVKSYGADKIFSVSPSADMQKNRDEDFADVTVWLKQDGYVDWLIPQAYFGFENEKMPFEQVIQQWENLPKAESVRLVCGLAAYKQGKEDEYAGTGHMEWKQNTDVLTRQRELISSHAKWDGYCLFSYSDSFSE
ncbi:MAG TPA: hypothetical protein DDY98_04885 [Ruminococcaceae bacterium]|nr:hypothetical protein [Oscillospiraceae bacterium]